MTHYFLYFHIYSRVRWRWFLFHRLCRYAAKLPSPAALLGILMIILASCLMSRLLRFIDTRHHARAHVIVGRYEDDFFKSFEQRLLMILIPLLSAMLLRHICIGLAPRHFHRRPHHISPRANYRSLPPLHVSRNGTGYHDIIFIFR